MSPQQYTVSATAPDESLVSSIVASLPVSLAWARPDAAADIVAVDGSGDWAAAATRAIASGARGVVVVAPRIPDPDAVDALASTADAAGAPVLLAEPFASNPAVAALESVAREALQGASAITVSSVEASVSLDELLLTQLRILRALGLPDVTFTSRDDRSASGTTYGSVGSTVLSTSMTASSVDPHHSVRAYGPTHVVELDLLPNDTARPSHAAVVDDAGERMLPTLYETADRSVWRSAVAAVAQGRRTGPDLRAFADDVRLATATR